MRYVTFNWKTHALGVTKEFADPNELWGKEYEDTYFLDESDVRRFLDSVKAHPEPTARFIYDGVNHMLGYEGNFDSEEAFKAHLDKAYGEGPYTILDPNVVRRWTLE